MRLIKMFGLAALAVVAAMALVGVTSASAVSTQLCKIHTSLLCPAGEGQTHVHGILDEGTVGTLLAAIDVLCLGVLVENEVGGLTVNSPQKVQSTALSFTGCGTGSAHNNCTVTVQEQPLSHLLKTGLNQGMLVNLSGRTRLQCSNLGIDCVYDLEGSEFTAAGKVLTAENTPTEELGGKFFCPNEGFLDGKLVGLLDSYILG